MANSMTTAKTRKTLRTAFADFEAAYVGVDAICRESEAVEPGRAKMMIRDMRAAHFQFRHALAEVERAKAMEESA